MKEQKGDGDWWCDETNEDSWHTQSVPTGFFSHEKEARDFFRQVLEGTGHQHAQDAASDTQSSRNV
jgi:hypothetical protein